MYDPARFIRSRGFKLRTRKREVQSSGGKRTGGSCLNLKIYTVYIYIFCFLDFEECKNDLFKGLEATLDDCR